MRFTCSVLEERPGGTSWRSLRRKSLTWLKLSNNALVIPFAVSMATPHVSQTTVKFRFRVFIVKEEL